VIDPKGRAGAPGPIRLDGRRDDAAALWVGDRHLSENPPAENPLALPPSPPPPPPPGAVPLHLFARTASGEPVAGLLGHLQRDLACLRIDLVWIEAAYRTEGFVEGLLDWAEDRARTEGCAHALLRAGAVRAPGLCRKLRYLPCAVANPALPNADERALYKRL